MFAYFEWRPFPDCFDLAPPLAPPPLPLPLPAAREEEDLRDERFDAPPPISLVPCHVSLCSV